MQTNLSFTQPSQELTSALAQTISSVEAKCPLCGGTHPVHALGEGSDLVSVCSVCRPVLIEKPLLPEGHVLQRELGRGGMGAVYLTKFQDEARAVKVLLPNVATSGERRRLFLQEASIQKQLRHSTIVSLYGLHQIVPGVFCLVMEYVPGKNAAELLSINPLAPQDAQRLILQALDGLAYIHQNGFLHRDLKDANLLLSEDLSQSKISDFGLAIPFALLGKNLDAEHEHSPSGTLPYMAPEAFQRHKPSPLLDIYAMGATLYRLLSGEYPHDFSVGKSKLVVAALDPIVPLQTRRPELPPSLVEVVHRALARDPSERFQSAQEMHDALSAV